MCVCVDIGCRYAGTVLADFDAVDKRELSLQEGDKVCVAAAAAAGVGFGVT